MAKSFKVGKLYRCCSSENRDIVAGTTIFVLAVLPFDREQVRKLPLHTYNLDEAGMTCQSILRLEHWDRCD